MKAALLALALLLSPAIADAQRLTEARGGAAPAVDTASRATLSPTIDPTYPRNGAMAFTGTLFAAGGIFAGGYIGAGMACGGANGDDWCELGGAIVGALVGEMIMLPLGVHIASDRSSYGKKLLVSSAVMLGGMVLAPLTGGISLLAAPPLQLMTVMGVEKAAVARSTGR